MNVGVRELRDGLSRYLMAVRGGAELTVTDHGKAVARLVPLGGESGLELLMAPALVRELEVRAAARAVPVGRILSEVVAVGLDHAEPESPRMRNGFPVMSGSTGHVVTDDLVAAHRDDA